MIGYLLDINPVQFFDGLFHKRHTHGAETSACAIGIRLLVGVVDNTIQTQVRRAEMKEPAAFFVVVEVFIVGGVHLHR